MNSSCGRILLVEDHVDTARVFSALLTQDGFSVTVASTLANALGCCRDGCFDLLICDLQLPDGDGTQALLAARNRSAGVAGIVVTGLDDAPRRQAAVDAGFAEYLVKPLTYADLRDAVLRAIPAAAPAPSPPSDAGAS